MLNLCPLSIFSPFLLLALLFSVVGFCCCNCHAGRCTRYYGKIATAARSGERKKTEEANERWREERNRRSDDLREAWSRHHPSEQKKFGKGRPKKRHPAWANDTSTLKVRRG